MTGSATPTIPTSPASSTTAWRVYFVGDTGLVDTGTAGTVTDRGPKDPDVTEVEQVGAKVAQTRRQLARDMAALAAAVRTAAEQGVPDTELARQAGVARDTIRRMLGKVT